MVDFWDRLSDDYFALFGRLEKSQKIQADHCERIRILEVALQQSTDRLKEVIKEKETPLTHCVKMQIEVKSVVNQLEDAIKNSHQIAIREY